MAFYSYYTDSKALIEISDFPIPTIDGSSVSEIIGLSKNDITSQYDWDISTVSFIPKTYRILTKKQFLKKLTPQEFSNIKTATTINGIVDYYWQLFMVAEEINLDDIDTIQGCYALEQLGLLNIGRAMEILS